MRNNKVKKLFRYNLGSVKRKERKVRTKKNYDKRKAKKREEKRQGKMEHKK